MQGLEKEQQESCRRKKKKSCCCCCKMLMEQQEQESCMKREQGQEQGQVQSKSCSLSLWEQSKSLMMPVELELKLEHYTVEQEGPTWLGLVGEHRCFLSWGCLGTEGQPQRSHPVQEPIWACLLYTSPSPRDRQKSRMPSSA